MKSRLLSLLRILDWHYSPLLLAVILAGVSGLRLFGPGRDYASGYGYANMFAWAKALPSVEQLSTFPHHDMGFGLYLYGLAQLCSWSDAWFFFWVAVPVLAIKFWCFRRYSPNYKVALLIYMSIFFIVHDYTQLRVGSALAVLMLAVAATVVEKRLLIGSALAASAVSLHLSTAVFLLYLVAFALSIKLFIVLAGGALLSGSLLESLPTSDSRITTYIALAKTQSVPNPFSSLKLYQYVTLGLFFYYRSAIRREGWLMVDASGWFLLAGVALFFGTISVPGFAHRFSELFAAFMPFLIAGLSTLLPKQWAFIYVSMGVLVGCWSSFRILH